MNWKKTKNGVLVPPDIVPVKVRARYDAAQTTNENTRHWSYADALSPNEANSVAVRAALRNRARYEIANNTYAKGIILTIANDVIGTGPRLQLMLGDNDEAKAMSADLEAQWRAWADEIDLAGKLRTMRMAKAGDGEAFAVLTTNPKLESQVKLDIQLFEAEQIATPYGLSSYLEEQVDGINFDAYGNPVSYYVFTVHPGSVGYSSNYVRVPAASMIHWYRADRPGHHRPVPEITSALPLFALLRRYTLAEVTAAETAANFAAVLKVQPANEEDVDIEPMVSFDLERNMVTTVPGELAQIKAEHPATTYPEFKKELLNEIARCLNIPYNIAACNSSSYNYASGRLDHQTYYKAIFVEQHHLEVIGLNKILKAWLQEAALEGLAPAMQNYPHEWFWDGTEHVDPAKEASAQAQRLANHTTTLAAEYAKQGKDWETEIKQRAREKELMESLGLGVSVALPKEEKVEENVEE